MTNRFHVIIPARMHSTRLPQKMTLEVEGTPLIVLTARQASKSNASQVVVATDHEEIFKICRDHDIQVTMTDSSHASGTDRIAQVAKSLGLYEHEIIVNVQGDEPLINPELINRLAAFTFDKNADSATVASHINERIDLFNPNVVKVALDKHNNALYFSRSPIPFYRDGKWDNPQTAKFPELPILRHIGMYAYTVNFLDQYSTLMPSPLEQVESLEQLRILYNGRKIAVLVSNYPHHPGVDTLEDLQRLRETLKQNKLYRSKNENIN